jgi:glucokinase
MTSLVADIGGTNARFALVEPQAGAPGPDRESSDLRAVCSLATEAYASVDELLAAALAKMGSSTLTSACVAIAGPVTDGAGTITNGVLQFDQHRIAQQLNCQVRVVNDFYALACAVPVCDQLQVIPNARSTGDELDRLSRARTTALIGPGTGLGMAVLLREASGYRVLPSEGGHADLAPGSPLEQEILSILSAEGHVCWESVLCGSGLERLYRAVGALWGGELPAMTASEISAAGINADDPICHQTLEMFFGLLGSAAGNLALTVCADAVYIGGGIVPKLMDFVSGSPFRRRFEERGILTQMMEQTPTVVIMDEHPGLLGAARCLDVN